MCVFVVCIWIGAVDGRCILLVMFFGGRFPFGNNAGIQHRMADPKKQDET